MRSVWKVLYVIYATVLLLVVGSLARQRQQQLFFENEGNQAITSSDEYEKFYFFYGAVGYHLRVSPMMHENEAFTIAFFEVYRKDQDLPIFYVMLHPKDEGFKKDERVLYSLRFNYGDDEEKTYDFDRFRDLQMYVLVNEERQAEIKISDIVSLEPHTITVIKEYAYLKDNESEPEIIKDEFDFLYTITSSDLIIEKAIKDVGKDDDLLFEKGIYPKHYHSIKKYAYIFYLSVSGGLIVVVLGAYFLFYFKQGKKDYIGSKKPSKTFKDFGYQEKEYKDPLAVEEDD